MSHGSKHIGDIAALDEDLVVKRSHIRRDFVAIEFGNAGHRTASRNSFGYFRLRLTAYQRGYIFPACPELNSVVGIAESALNAG